jgi:hypothetical protein
MKGKEIIVVVWMCGGCWVDLFIMKVYSNSFKRG